MKENLKQSNYREQNCCYNCWHLCEWGFCKEHKCLVRADSICDKYIIAVELAEVRND